MQTRPFPAAPDDRSPVGTAFQYPCDGAEALTFICVTMPRWPGHHEATIIPAPWEPNAPEGW